MCWVGRKEKGLEIPRKVCRIAEKRHLLLVWITSKMN